MYNMWKPNSKDCIYLDKNNEHYIEAYEDLEAMLEAMLEGDNKFILSYWDAPVRKSYSLYNCTNRCSTKEFYVELSNNLVKRRTTTHYVAYLISFSELDFDFTYTNENLTVIKDGY